MPFLVYFRSIPHITQMKKPAVASNKEKTTTSTDKPKRRAKPGSRTNSKILLQQQSKKYAISKSAIERLVRHYASQLSSKAIRMSAGTLQVLHRNVEAFLIKVLSQSKRQTEFAGRQTTTSKDVRQVCLINESLPKSVRNKMVGLVSSNIVSPPTPKVDDVDSF